MTAPTQFADANLDPRDERELRWFLCESDGALGLRSSMGAQLARAEAAPGRNRGSKPLGQAVAAEWTEAQLAAVDRARRVERRLASLTRPQQRVLVAAYGPPLPPGGEETWGWLSPSFRSRLRPLSLLLVAERQGITRAALKAWHKAILGDSAEVKAEAKKKLEVLRQDAEVALVRACRGYETTGEVRARRRRR